VTENGGAERRNPEPAGRQQHIPRAIAYMVAAGAIFSFTSAASKWLVETYPVGQVLFARAFVALVLFAAFVLPRAGWSVFATRRPGAHLLRGVSQATAQTLLVLALSLMPLASVTAINFSAPLFATLASMFFLRETAGAARWAALLAGFAGVLIITNPGAADTFQIGALFALANAVLFGTVTTGVRGMTATESAETLTMYQLLLLSVVFALSLPFAFVMPNAFDAAIFVASGVTGVLGQYWWTRALHLAPTSAVVPFQYLSLLWAMIFGFAIWGDVPTAGLLIGSAIVVGSGLYLFWHESRPRKPD
jgi:drug/metabolite transporter (DMT)-like permease